jgi:hypothetical protein
MPTVTRYMYTTGSGGKPNSLAGLIRLGANSGYLLEPCIQLPDAPKGITSFLVLGVIGPSGNEVGPFRAVEEGMLASLSLNRDMSDIFAWHIVAGTLVVSFGTFSSGCVMLGLQKLFGWTEQRSYKGLLWLTL